MCDDSNRPQQVSQECELCGVGDCSLEFYDFDVDGCTTCRFIFGLTIFENMFPASIAVKMRNKNIKLLKQHLIFANILSSYVQLEESHHSFSLLISGKGSICIEHNHDPWRHAVSPYLMKNPYCLVFNDKTDGWHQIEVWVHHSSAVTLLF